jgi:hypothetical protein
MAENTNYLASTKNSIKLTGNVGIGGGALTGWGNATYVLQDNKNYNAGSITAAGLTDANGNTVVVGTFIGTRSTEKIITITP